MPQLQRNFARMVFEKVSHPAHCIQNIVEVRQRVQEVGVQGLKDLQELLICQCEDIDQHEAKSLVTRIASSLTIGSSMACLEPGNEGIDLLMFSTFELHELIHCRKPCFFRPWCQSLLQGVDQ